MATNPSTDPSKADGTPAPWYAAYPAPKSEATTISREEVLAMLKATPLGNRDFVLVDLRRNDFEVSWLVVPSTNNESQRGFTSLLEEWISDNPVLNQGGTIRGSINLPAQSLYPTLPTLYAMFKAAGLRKIIFYCGSYPSRRSLPSKSSLSASDGNE